MEGDEWKDIPGFECLYQVSKTGQVKSLGRTTIGGSRGGPCTKTYQPRILEPVPGGKGRDRARVNLYFQTNGAGQRKRSPYIIDVVREVFGDESAKALPAVFRKKNSRGATGARLMVLS